MERLESLRKSIECLEDSEKIILDPLLVHLAEWEAQMDYLKTLPQIKVHPDNPALQKQTEAAKQYKIVSQSYMNGIRILINALKNHKENETNELLERLEKFV